MRTSTHRRSSKVVGPISPRLRRFAARKVQSSYSANTQLARRVAWLFPGFLVAPSSLNFITGALTLPRVALFIAAVPAFRELWRKVTSGGYVPIASDVLVPFMAFWMLMTLVILEGGKGLIGYGAVSAIEFLFAYFIARVFFGTLSGFQQLIRVLRIVTACLVISAVLDMVSGQHLLLNIGRILSRTPLEEIVDRRFGLVRAQGSLENPILFGVFFVVCVLLIGHSNLRTTEKIISLAISIFGVFLPLSSAPILALIMSIGTIAFLRAFDRFPWRMVVFLSAALFLLGTFFALVDDPLPTLIRNLTYDPQTGLFRLQIWQWVFVNVERAPWIGIGFADWVRAEEMPSSIDSLYLIQTIRHGLPALALLILSMLSTGITMPLRPQTRYPNAQITRLRQGLGISIFIFSFNAFTVHFWGAAWTLLALVLGARAGLTESLYLPPSIRDDDLRAAAQSFRRNWHIKRPFGQAFPAPTTAKISPSG